MSGLCWPVVWSGVGYLEKISSGFGSSCAHLPLSRTLGNIMRAGFPHPDQSEPLEEIDPPCVRAQHWTTCQDWPSAAVSSLCSTTSLDFSAL